MKTLVEFLTHYKKYDQFVNDHHLDELAKEVEQEIKELESQASHWHEAYSKAEQEIQELKEENKKLLMLANRLYETLK